MYGSPKNQKLGALYRKAGWVYHALYSIMDGGVILYNTGGGTIETGVAVETPCIGLLFM